MQKYYKIIGYDYPFFNVYGLDNPANVPLYTTFTAYNPKKSGGYFINSKKPVIHFCDNAFDTMLWHSVFIIADELPAVIYEIKPIGSIIKQKCRDDSGIFQCGAEQIQFIRPVSTDEMFERALAEFHQNHKAKINLYPNLEISKIISAWVHHERSKYVY